MRHTLALSGTMGAAEPASKVAIADRPLLDVRNLVKHFPIGSQRLGRETAKIQAVDGLSFTLRKGETVGLVGESGCGKSTVGRVILRLIEPTSGEIYLDGHNIFALNRKNSRELCRRMQIIFRDPYASLSPRMTAGSIIEEGLRIHKLGDCRAAKGAGSLHPSKGRPPPGAHAALTT